MFSGFFLLKFGLIHLIYKGGCFTVLSEFCAAQWLTSSDSDLILHSMASDLGLQFAKIHFMQHSVQIE